MANPQIGECCVPAPPILEFDPDGNLVKAWGGPAPGTNGPNRITASRSTTRTTCGSAATDVSAPGTPQCPAGTVDSFILKFTHDGKFLMEIGGRTKR